jgi:hypothetical protein
MHFLLNSPREVNGCGELIMEDPMRIKGMLVLPIKKDLFI